MFRTAIKTLSLFRKVYSETTSLTSNKYIKYNSYRIQKIEQPKLYNDTLNIFMVGALLNEPVNKRKNTEYNHDKYNHDKYNHDEYNHDEYNHDESCYNQEKIFKCQITGCEKRINNEDCSCTDKCIVEKSELSIICDLLQ
jgi:hypothetical protein